MSAPAKSLSIAQLNALVGAFVHRNPRCNADSTYCGGTAGNARGRMVEGLREMGLFYTYPGRNRPPVAGSESDLTVAGLQALRAHLLTGKAPRPARSWGAAPMEIEPIIAQLDEAIPARIAAEEAAAQALAEYEAAERQKSDDYSARERTRKLARFRQIARDHRIDRAFEDDDALLAFCEQIVDAEMDA